MDYYSSKEIADKWGISSRRVTVLAKSGRIPGALLMGHTWMIPKDAQKPQNPQKPRDISDDNYSHHSVCTLYLHRFDGLGNERKLLNKDEQILYDAQELFVHNDLMQAQQMLMDLVCKSSDTYILIGSFVILVYISIETKNIPLYKKCLLELRLIFADDFPAKDVLKLLLYDVEAHSAVRELRSTEIDMSFINSCPSDCSSIVLVCVFYSALMDQVSGKKMADTTLLELLCRNFDQQGFYFTSQLLHAYLASIYFLNNAIEKCIAHLRTAMSLSVKYDSYYALATTYRILGQYYNELLSEYPSYAKEKLLNRSKNFTEGLALFEKHFSVTDKNHLSLSIRDYEYIVYAIRGMTNSEIARCKGISEPTVSKYYSSLYATVGVKNKKELVEVIHSQA